MDPHKVILKREDVERAIQNAKELFGSENDWMGSVMEIALLPAVQEWIKKNTRQAMVIERAGGNEDPSRERFASPDEWRSNFYRFPGYVLKSTTLEGYQYNGVPTNQEESESRGYSHGPRNVIEGLRRDWPEIYWQLVYFLNTVLNKNYKEEGLVLVLEEDLCEESSS